MMIMKLDGDIERGREEKCYKSVTLRMENDGVSKCYLLLLCDDAR